MKTPSNGNNDSIDRRANTRAPAPVDVTPKGKRTEKSDNKKNRIAGECVCEFVFLCA